MLFYFLYILQLTFQSWILNHEVYFHRYLVFEI